MGENCLVLGAARLSSKGHMTPATAPPPAADHAVLADYHGRFMRLAAHPDKAVIDDLVRFAQLHVTQSFHIVKVLVSRFMDRNVPPSHKLPILYVVDATMKYVGGPYPYHFSRYAVDVARRGLTEMAPGKDQQKLDFLLQTWLERNLLHASVMPALVEARAQWAAQAAANTIVNASVGAGTAYHQPYAQQQYQQPPPPPPQVGPAAAMQREMQMQLDQMLVGMGSSIALEELRIENPEVYESIRQQAEINLSLKYPHLAPRDAGASAGVARAPPKPPASAAAKPAATVLPPAAQEPYLSRWGHQHEAGMYEVAGATKLGFIAEAPVVVSVTASADLAARMDVEDDSVPCYVLNSESKRRAMWQARSLARQRLQEALAEDRPELPDIVTGPVPLEPSRQYRLGFDAYNSAARKAAQNTAIGGSSSSAFGLSRVKVPMPCFDTSKAALARPKESALRGLYLMRRYQFNDDALRFTSQQDLDDYIDKSAVRKIKLQTLSSSGVMQSRAYFYHAQQWCEDYEPLLSSLDQSMEAAVEVGSGSAGLGADGVVSTGSSNNASAGLEDSWLYTVPADENFVRCPVSKNLFTQKWDDDEGEMLYTNAVKVFVTAAADPAIFNLAQPIESDDDGMDDDSVRYLLVDKKLVLTPWLENGKAAPVQDALERYQTMLLSVEGGGEGQQKQQEASYEQCIARLKRVSEDEDREHCFAMIELH